MAGLPAGLGEMYINMSDQQPDSPGNALISCAGVDKTADRLLGHAKCMQTTPARCSGCSL